MEFSINPETGQVFKWDPAGGPDWQEVPHNQVAANPKTKQVFVLNGEKWQELPSPSQGGVMDVLHNIATGVGKAAANAAAGVAALENLGEPMRAGMRGVPMQFQDPRAVQQKAEETVFGPNGLPYYTPSTAGGRIGQAAVAGGAGGLLAGGGVPGVVAGTLGGVAQQGAAEAGLPEGAQMLAGVAAPMVAGGAYAGGRAMFPGATRAVEDLARRLTPQQVNDAYALMQDARARGIALTWPEVFSQVTGGDMRQMLSVQRVLEQSRSGSAILDRIMAQRAGQNQDAMTAQLDQIGPQQQGQALGDVPTEMQTAAVNANAAARRDRFNQTDPHYQQGRQDNIPAVDAHGVLARIDAAIAAAPSNAVVRQLQQFRDDILGVAPRPGMPRQVKTNVGQLDSVVKFWRDRIDTGARPGQLSEQPLANETVALIGPILTDLRDSMTRSSEPHAYGRVRHQQISEETVNPMRRGPVGQLERATPTLRGQREVIAPLGEQQTLDPAQVRFTVNQLQQYGSPGVVRNWVRANLESLFSESNQDNIPGANQWGGAKFRAVIEGNTQQAANFEALVTALPNGRAIWPGLRRLLDIYQAQGRRQAPGSMTEFNKQITEQLGGGKINIQFVSRLQNAIDQARYWGRSRQLAELITNPDNIERWRALSQGRRGGAGFALGIVGPTPGVSQAPALGTSNLFGVPVQ